jgi:hypothetical protein
MDVKDTATVPHMHGSKYAIDFAFIGTAIKPLVK